MSAAKALTIAGVSLRRLFRDRVGLFFVIVLPVLITTAIGLTAFGAGGAGGSTLLVGLANEDRGALARELGERIDASASVETRTYQDAAELRAAVRRGYVLGGVVIPNGYDAELRAGRSAEVEYLSNPTASAPAGLRTSIAAAVAEQGARVRAAAFAVTRTGIPFDAAYERASAAAGAPAVSVAAETVTAARSVPRGFDYPAGANLILFMFITSMAGASDLILARQLGVSRRMLGTPTTAGTVLAGEALGRLAIALFQGLFIFVVGTAVFGVRFGDPLGVGLLVIAFGLVSTAVAMLFGTIFRTPDQAGSIGPPVGIALGMLGGCMWPLEIVPPLMRQIGHLTPHAWAMDAMLALMAKGADTAAILPQLLVLLGFSAALLPLATWRLRRAIVG